MKTYIVITTNNTRITVKAECFNVAVGAIIFVGPGSAGVAAFPLDKVIGVIESGSLVSDKAA
jgi:hypothetical protein